MYQHISLFRLGSEAQTQVLMLVWLYLPTELSSPQPLNFVLPESEGCGMLLHKGLIKTLVFIR